MRVQEERLFVYVNSSWMLMYIWIRSWHVSGLQVHLVTRHTKPFFQFLLPRAIDNRQMRSMTFISLSLHGRFIAII